MSNAIELSEYIIYFFSSKGKTITNLKLQKILYYIQGYCLRNDFSAFDEDIYNWPYGPVVPDVYFEYSIFGSQSLSLKNDEEIVSIDNKDVLKISNKVLAACIDTPAYKLVDKTHSEEPWLNTKRGFEIPTEKIKSYFCNNDPLCICDKKEK